MYTFVESQSHPHLKALSERRAQLLRASARATLAFASEPQKYSELHDVLEKSRVSDAEKRAKGASHYSSWLEVVESERELMAACLAMLEALDGIRKDHTAPHASVAAIDVGEGLDQFQVELLCNNAICCLHQLHEATITLQNSPRVTVSDWSNPNFRLRRYFGADAPTQLFSEALGWMNWLSDLPAAAAGASHGQQKLFLRSLAYAPLTTDDQGYFSIYVGDSSGEDITAVVQQLQAGGWEAKHQAGSFPGGSVFVRICPKESALLPSPAIVSNKVKGWVERMFAKLRSKK